MYRYIKTIRPRIRHLSKIKSEPFCIRKPNIVFKAAVLTSEAERSELNIINYLAIQLYDPTEAMFTSVHNFHENSATCMFDNSLISSNPQKFGGYEGYVLGIVFIASGDFQLKQEIENQKF